MYGLHKGLLIFKSICEPVKRYFFHTRNSFFQFLYLFLVSTFHAVGIYDGLAAVEATEPHSHHLLTLIIILAINIFAFLLCSYSDPGIIKKECSLNIYWQYPYDEVIFLPNTKCPTCGIFKPARSKHCRLMNKCIHKFDHYCIWVSNAVGGNNHRFFLLLLATLVLMIASGCYHLVKAIRALSKIFRCWEIAKLRYSGGPLTFLGQIPNIYLTYAQLIVSNFPRLVIILTSCSTVLPCIVCFFLYHIYLAVSNETTNERYKKWQMKPHLSCPDKVKDHIRNCKVSNIKATKNIYSKGVLENLAEEFFPTNPNILKRK